ncbi:MAG: DUF2141 domain-containing protein [Prevotellaceae bacterium]|nr:DUF2141 domain-containing protein [Prevotellaceae bacterium]
MQKTITLLILSLITFAATAQSLKVKITNIDNVKGTLYVRLYTENQDFGKEQCLALKTIKITKQTESCEFENLPPAKYAVYIYQDENSNGIFDRKLKVLPAEPYGLSNNPKIFGRPKFSQCSFDFSKSAEIVIKMK